MVKIWMGIAGVALLAGGGLMAKVAWNTAPGTTLLTLRAQNGSPLPVSRVPNITTVRIPILPKSHITASRSLPLGIISPEPGTPDVHMAKSAVYSIHLPPALASRILEHYFSSRQYQRISVGSFSNHTVSESIVSYAKSVNGNLVFNLTWYAASQSVTRYGYYVSQVVTSSPPKSTRIPFDLIRLTGTIQTGHQERSVSSTHKPALRKLARALDALHTVDFGLHCPLVRDSAHLILIPRQGRAMRVSIASGCSVSVNGVAFQDYPAKPVWSALLRAVK